MSPITATLLFLARIYPGGTDPEELSVAWQTALPDMHPEVMREAAIEYVRTPGNRFHPTPGDLLEIIERYSSAKRPSWEEARKRVVGKPRSEADQGVLQIVDMFGEQRFRDAGDEPDFADRERWDIVCKQHAALVYVTKREAVLSGQKRITTTPEKP